MSRPIGVPLRHKSGNIYDTNGYRLASALCGSNEDMDYIALAVNSHDDLLAACKVALAGFLWHYEHGSSKHDDSSRRIVAMVEAAIRKAEWSGT